jgi:hypothetical protein
MPPLEFKRIDKEHNLTFEVSEIIPYPDMVVKLYFSTAFSGALAPSANT